MLSSLDAAQHEAAHVVVGVALKLRLKLATIQTPEPEWDGFTWFPNAVGCAGALMYAAGIYWSRKVSLPWHAAGDLDILKSLGHSAADIKALSLAAGAILNDRLEAHALVTRALIQHQQIDSTTILQLAQQRSK